MRYWTGDRSYVRMDMGTGVMQGDEILERVCSNQNQPAESRGKPIIPFFAP